jgi:hypothetical protein
MWPGAGLMSFSTERWYSLIVERALGPSISSNHRPTISPKVIGCMVTTC